MPDSNTHWLPFVAVTLLVLVAAAVSWWARGHVDKEHWLEKLADTKVEIAKARSEGYSQGQASSMASFAHVYQREVRRLYSEHGLRAPNQYRTNRPDKGRHAVDTGFIPKVTDNGGQTATTVPPGATAETTWG